MLGPLLSSTNDSRGPSTMSRLSPSWVIQTLPLQVAMRAPRAPSSLRN
jgi:hypothetical protein